MESNTNASTAQQPLPDASVSKVEEHSVWVSTHPHVLEFSPHSGWRCDCSHLPSGCLSPKEPGSPPPLRFRCALCDYDECEACAASHRV